MARTLRLPLIPRSLTALVAFAALLPLVITPGAEARPGRGGGGFGGPASGAGVRPGAGWGAPGAGVSPAPGLGGGGLGGPASGAGVRPGAGWGAPGAGVSPAPGLGGGGLGGPASGAGVRPGAGWGAPGAGLTRAPGAAYGGAVYHPGWVGGGYWAARPWPYGWYGAQPLAWWGAAAVASTATVSAAVNAAAAQQTVWIVVPQTGLQLNYASVRAEGNSGVQFAYLADGVSVSASGDCRSGQFNGAPAQGQTAQLLNAACQVAYSSGG